MSVYITITTILAVTLWSMDSAAALKCNGCDLESWLDVHLDRGSVQYTGREGPICKCTG